MTQQLANKDEFMLPMNNKIFQQGKKSHSCSRVRWIAEAPIAVLAPLSVTAPAQIAWYNSSWQYRKKPNIIAWVKIASNRDTDDTQICMHCGKNSATSQQNDRAVWNFGGSNDSRSVWQQPGV
jgi:hypothetical protein